MHAELAKTVELRVEVKLGVCVLGAVCVCVTKCMCVCIVVYVCVPYSRSSGKVVGSSCKCEFKRNGIIADSRQTVKNT